MLKVGDKVQIQPSYHYLEHAGKFGKIESIKMVKADATTFPVYSLGQALVDSVHGGYLIEEIVPCQGDQP